MTISRRDFIKTPAILGATALITGASRAPKSVVENRYPVLQGATSFTKTQINVMAPEDLQITVPGGKVSVTRVVKDFSVWRAFRVVVEDLQPGKEYELKISTPDGKLLDSRKFSTLTPDKTKVRFALASCMRDTRAEFQAPMWKALEETKPDVLFLLGDNVYVDDEVNAPKGFIEERLWRRYVETRVTLDLYHLKTLIPSLAIWDDHDFGLNNSYGNTPWRGPATEVFRTLYAQDAIMPEVTWGPGIATAFTAYGQRFYLMDNRSFRGHPMIGRDHWGGPQEEWLLSGLNSHSGAGWIFSGSQIFGGYRSGWSYETQHPLSLRRMLKKLKNVKAPVLFGTGDVHYSEIMKVEKELLGYDTIEITSSSMHSNAKEPRKNNKRRIASIGEFNFVVADVNVFPTGLELALRSHGSGNKQYFEVDKLKISR